MAVYFGRLLENVENCPAEELRRIEAAPCDPEGAFDTAIVDEPSVWYWGIRAEGAAKSLGRRSVR